MMIIIVQVIHTKPTHKVLSRIRLKSIHCDQFLKCNTTPFVAVISDTNAIEPVSYKKLNDAEDDNQLKKDANSQSTAIIDDAKSNLDTGASKKQASANESSNLKAAEKFTSSSTN